MATVYVGDEHVIMIGQEIPPNHIQLIIPLEWAGIDNDDTLRTAISTAIKIFNSANQDPKIQLRYNGVTAILMKTGFLQYWFKLV